MKRKTVLFGLLLAALAEFAAAENVDLVTLPGRQTVQLTIYNSEDLTLVREIRYVTVKKGINSLQFSWANTLIDPTSVELRPLEHTDKIEVVDTVFPGRKPQHSIWNLQSDYEGQVKIEVSYFTSGLTWQMDYVATTDPEETKMDFRGYVRVFNQSGEEYENAEVRLIVGNINLVESIAELARRQGVPVPQSGTKDDLSMKRLALRESCTKAEVAAICDEPAPMEKPRGIVKEGLSEYFMFSVEGEETISNGWSKRMISTRAENAPFEIVYRQRAYQYGPQPNRFFVWRNDEEHLLGECPLPNGTVRVYRENGKDGLSYLGAADLRYVPIKGEIEVNLGTDDLVVFRERKMDTRRNNFMFDRHNNCVTGWDETQQWIYEVRNYRTKPIRFKLRLQYPGDVEFASEVKTKSFDFNTVESNFSVDSRGKKEYPATVVIHHGTNAKQNRVKLAEEGT
jgi:hypothetical protein